MTIGMLHTVYFWLTPGLSADERSNFVAGAKALAEAPTVAACHVSIPASTPERDVTDHSFDYSLLLMFANVADHDAYQISDVHLKFVADQAAKFAVVKVYDGEVV